MFQLTLAAIMLAAPVPKSDTANSKVTLAVLAELGLTDSFGKLSDVPERFIITAGDLKNVRENPDEFPLRAVILKAGQRLAKTRATELPRMFRAKDGLLDRKPIKAAQEKAALRILENEESVDELRSLGRLAAKESHPRWLAHYHLLLADALATSVRDHEYNALLGRVLIDDERMPLMAEYNGWQILEGEKMLGRKAIKDAAKEAKERFSEVAKDYRGTPWAELAEKFEGRSLAWQWQAVKLEKK